MTTPSYLPKTVMITGATGGFGEAFTRIFAAAGCRLVLTSRRADALDALCAQLPVPVHKIILDMRDRAAIEGAFAAIPPDYADIDLLINNAGNAFGLEPAHESSLDDWEAMIETNNLGLVACTRLVLPRMVARKSGHVINIGSIAGTYPYPQGHVYCATKAFVHQFSLALRADLNTHNVRVTCIEPGMAQTTFSLNRFKGDAARAAGVYEGAAPLTAEDVAQTVFFAATQPAHVNINRIELMPTTQAPAALAVHRK